MSDDGPVGKGASVTAGEGVLVLNAGSSSIKFALYRASDLSVAAEGQVAGLTGGDAHFAARLGDGAAKVDEVLGPAGHREALARVIGWLSGQDAGRLPGISAAGHRIVHGGGVFAAPERVNDALLERLRAFIPLAPRHQPHNIAGIEAMATLAPELPQVGCFDTAFHAAMPEVRTRLPVPDRFHRAGLRRYGFHGLSYQSIVDRFERMTGTGLPERLVVAHLGAGASLAGVRAGRGVYTTMGFSPLDGLMMATRPGRLDPGALLHLMREEGLDAARLERLLYDECGLLGVSDESADMKSLMESGTAGARVALDLYLDRLVQEIASAAAALDGIDALVFTGGVGENAVGLRAEALERLAWMGFRLDPAANAGHGPCITRDGGGPAAYRVPTDEQWVIAEACRTVLREGALEKS
ncbi:acetate/propionate family kinase [Marivibrio halodurans]|uniref:Acetate kinase n=1 Tax=Marivibrio halodurans TaxID=2039722 RepID=A0A8J7S4U8_9PROT|nr:acetate/propionate family kinase [Marivibrio halodurans]